MHSSNKINIAGLGVAALLGAAAAQADILFQETFESGSNPFGFDGFQSEGSQAVGRLAEAGSPHGRVWETVLAPGRQQGLVGHRLIIESDQDLPTRLHWATYLKFGDRSGSYWLAAGDSAFDLQLPVVVDRDGRPLLTGRFRPTDRQGYFGTFELVTADGQVHRPAGGTLLAAGRWYTVEFGLEDRGGEDLLRIWIDNDDEQNPDYQHTGGDMLDSARWQPGVRVDLGYVRHPVPAETRFYYDAVTIADGFIGLPVEPAVPPTAPGRLQVE